MENKDLENRISEIERWIQNKKRHQISYPIDIQSLPALNPYYLRVFNGSGINKNSTYTGIGNTTIINMYEATSGNTVYKSVITVGPQTIANQGIEESSLNTQVYLENDSNTIDLNSFFYGYRKPLYKPKTGTTISVTSAGNTMTDSQKNWVTNELSGAYVNITNSLGVFQFTRQISSNTSTQITIDGTWPSSVAGGTYFIFMPIYLGSADYPWRQIYAGGTDVSSGGDGSVKRAIRIGYGTTAGTDSIGIFYGTSSPETVVTANVGSLFLRTDGGASTTLYVKTSGTGNTGWTAK